MKMRICDTSMESSWAKTILIISIHRCESNGFVAEEFDDFDGDVVGIYSIESVCKSSDQIGIISISHLPYTAQEISPRRNGSGETGFPQAKRRFPS